MSWSDPHAPPAVEQNEFGVPGQYSTFYSVSGIIIHSPLTLAVPD